MKSDVGVAVPGGSDAPSGMGVSCSAVHTNNALLSGVPKRLRCVVNRAPVLDPIGDKTVNEGSLLEFRISASDPDNDPLSFSAASLPAGSSFNQASRTFSWTPGFGQAGTYRVVFSVSDGVLSDSETIVINVVNVNRAPKIITTPIQELIEPDLDSFSAVYTYDADAIDPDGDNVTFSLSSAPEGATIDQSTGLVTWKPGRRQLGPSLFILVASDGSLSDTQAWTLNVKLPPRINIPRRELFVEQVAIPECIEPGSSETVFVSIENIGLHPLDDFTVTAVAFDPEIRNRIGPFNLDVGEKEERSFLLDVPEDAKPGRYDLRITFSDDFVRRVKHRDFEIRESCR
ncbi:hypothetical protein HYU11_02760 [Candidatus Woesearchaeota archaeon]|nr:hypothetical protein [Candidatus Woesearchaeota archaeon]